MDHRIQEQIQRSLRTFTQFYTAMVEQLEATLALIRESATLDPRAYFDQYDFPAKRSLERHGIVIDPRQFTVTSQNKTCFLNNSISFRLLVLLVDQANVLLPHDRIFEEVWETDRPCEAALRSAMKILRRKLRSAGLDSLADGIEGSVSGHYRLRLF